MANYVTGIQVNKQYGSDTIYAIWSWSLANTEQYEITWYYNTSDVTGNLTSVWFIGSETTSKAHVKQSTYDPPENARAVYVTIKPIAKNRQVNGKESPYWTAVAANSKIFYLDGSVYDIETPSAPEVALSLAYKYETETQTYDGDKTRKVLNRDKEQKQIMKLTAQLDIYTRNVTHVDFQVVRDHSKVYSKGRVAITKNHAAYTCNVDSGGSYKVRVRAVRETVTYVTSKSSPKNKTKKTLSYTSGWSEYSQVLDTAPGSVKISRIEARAVDSVFIGFWSVSGAENYECEYTQDKKNFDRNTSEVRNTTVDAEIAHSFIISGLESNKKWYFRVRAVNDVGNGPWTAILECMIGSKPEPPTTWVNVDSAVYDSIVPVYWTHNSADNSEQTMAEIYVCARPAGYVPASGDTESDVDDDGSIIAENAYTVEGTDSSYNLQAGEFLNNSQRADGLVMEWKVRTMGATGEFGDWSVVRTITLFSEPSASIGIYPKLSWYWDPFRFVGGSIYASIGNAVDFVRNTDISGPSRIMVPIEPIETVTSFPIIVLVNAYPDTQPVVDFTITITADNEYDTLDDFGNVRNVQPGDILYSTVVEGSDNTVTLKISAEDVDLDNDESYTIAVVATMVSGLTAEADYSFNVSWGDEKYFPDARIYIDWNNVSASIQPFCMNEFGRDSMDALLSVYRRDYDGKFIPIAENVDPEYRTTVIDPHPPLDMARYRIISKSKATGSVGFYDMPAYPIGETAAIIQWDEEWYDINTDDPDEMAAKSWYGSIVRLPYNIDVTAEVNQDAELVNYVGRENPVSYYGTIKNETGNWSLVVPYDDKETMSALRRLSKYPGDVYVREPGGTGYWAKVMVTLASSHDSPACNVTIAITRVEGGL